MGELWNTKDVCQETCLILLIVLSSDLLGIVELAGLIQFEGAGTVRDGRFDDIHILFN